MDTQRLILFFVFSFSLLLLWEAWQKEARVPVPTVQAPQSVPVPSAPSKAAPPVVTTQGPAPSAPTASSAGVPAATVTSNVRRERIRVTTDMFIADIDTEGGDIVYLELLQHKDTRDDTKNV